MKISISPKKAAWTLIVIITLLIVGSSLAAYSKYVLGHGRLLGIVWMLDLDDERSIGTVYALLTLLVSAFLAAIIAYHKKSSGLRFANYWKILSIIFVFLALDEGIGFHEFIMRIMREMGEFEGIFYFPWVIPGILLVLVFVIAYLPFLKNLPQGTRWGLLSAGAIYILGALVFELIAGQYLTLLHGERNLTYAIITNTEELLEMTGIAILITVLLSHIKNDMKMEEFGLIFRFHAD